MDDLLAGLETIVLGISLVLFGQALLVSRRYSEVRFACVGAGQLCLGIIGLLALLTQLDTGLPIETDPGYPTILLLLMAEGFLYLALALGPRTTVRGPDE